MTDQTKIDCYTREGEWIAAFPTLRDAKLYIYRCTTYEGVDYRPRPESELAAREKESLFIAESFVNLFSEIEDGGLRRDYQIEANRAEAFVKHALECERGK